MHKGDVYNMKKFQQNLYGNESESDISSLYLDNGYLAFQPEVTDKTIGLDKVDINIKFNENNQYRLGLINFEGNDKTKDKVLRRELYAIPGEYFNRANIKRSMQQLNALNYFNPEKLNQDIIRYKIDIAEKYPTSFVAFLINAMREPEIPEIPVLGNGRKDSTFAYRYVKTHFWDGTDFTDDRLLTTPVFDNKLKKYFDKVLYQTPDSIIKETDILIEKARPNKEMFKYLVWYATYHSESSEIMGFDRIFVHVVDTY